MAVSHAGDGRVAQILQDGKGWTAHPGERAGQADCLNHLGGGGDCAVRAHICGHPRQIRVACRAWLAAPADRVPKQLVIGGGAVARAVTRQRRQPVVGVGHQRALRRQRRQRGCFTVGERCAAFKPGNMVCAGDDDDPVIVKALCKRLIDAALHIRLAHVVFGRFIAGVRRSLPKLAAVSRRAQQIRAVREVMLKPPLPVRLLVRLAGQARERVVNSAGRPPVRELLTVIRPVIPGAGFLHALRARVSHR